MSERCIIVGGGDFSPALLPERAPGDLLLAADSGFAALDAMGVRPDICIGDFDSLGAPPNFDRVVRLPVEKDDTDLMAAVKLGLERGYRRFTLLGALGGRRFSHSLAAVQTLCWLIAQGARGELVSPGCRVTAVSGETLSYPASAHGSISVFAAGDSAVVTLRGLKYPLERHRLSGFFPLGVSNSFTGAAASVTVHEGIAVIVEEPDEQ